MDLALAIALPIAAASLLSLSYFILKKDHVVSHLDNSDTDADARTAMDPVLRFKSADIDALTCKLTSCTVYLASLPSSPSLVAVKVQNSSQQLHRVFRQELAILLSVKHPNVVRLLGYCDATEQGVLVFDYVPNGTLHGCLHTGLFVALALDYLHDGCELQIIHGDVKSSNVLLDDGLDPKLCDFGSGRMGFSAAVTRSANQMIGSLGYTDPHYLRTGLVSKKSDAYSFGVLILETVTGLEAFDPAKEQLLASVMKPALRRAVVDELVDPRLGDAYDAGEVSTMIEVASRRRRRSGRRWPRL